MAFSRRKFLTLASTAAAGATALAPLEAFCARVANGQTARGVGYGSLSPILPTNADELAGVVRGGIDLGSTPILQLPPGFNYTAISITGQPMDDGSSVPGGHDGMATFPGPNGTTILVRNHELSPTSSTGVVASKKYDSTCKGGTTTLLVGSNRRVIKQFASLGGTVRNCAGGSTPWGSWVSCEESIAIPALNSPVTKKHGYNFEVAATSDFYVADPIPLVAMGRFNHEAIAVDPNTGWVYETEDRGDSCFYRFRPNQYGNLQSGGVLEALVVEGAPRDTRTGYLGYKGVALSVSWVTIDDVDPATDTLRLEAQAKGAAIFSRGEGAWYANGLIYFVSTGGGNAGKGQVFAYDPQSDKLTLVVESTNASELEAPDNITVAPFGDLFLCEDGPNDNYVVGVNQSGELYQFAKNNINGSEYAGACFSPDGQTLFVNIQSPGITCAIWGPWSRRRS